MPTLNHLLRPRCLQTTVVLALVLLTFQSGAQSLTTPDDPALLSSTGSRAPLVLFINGPGRVLPFHDSAVWQRFPSREYSDGLHVAEVALAPGHASILGEQVG